MIDLVIAGHAIGLIGTAGICICHWVSIKGIVDPTSMKYLWLNLVSAILLLISLCINFNLGSFIIELVLIGITIQTMAKKKFKDVKIDWSKTRKGS